MKKYLYQYARGEPYVPYDTMVERMVGSTSSSSNMYGVVDDNSNPYSNMVMDVMRMNQGHVNQCSIIDEEHNIDEARFVLPAGIRPYEMMTFKCKFVLLSQRHV